MKRHLIGTASVAVLAACAGGRTASEPIYEIRATEAPIRYGLEATQQSVIELPNGGEQEIGSTTNATMAVSYGQPGEAGIPFVLTFEELQMGGAAGGADLSSVIGQPIRGTIALDGGISVEEAPEIDAPGVEAEGLVEVISPLIVPLPPDGDPDTESWPLERSRPVSGGMSGESSFTGMVRFTPANDWEGTPARVILSEGELRQRASGMPPGAPSEVDLDLEGESATTYAWDPARGIVLQVDQRVTLEGTVSTQGMALPMTTEVNQTIRLLP